MNKVSSISVVLCGEEAAIPQSENFPVRNSLKSYDFSQFEIGKWRKGVLLRTAEYWMT